MIAEVAIVEEDAIVENSGGSDMGIHLHMHYRKRINADRLFKYQNIYRLVCHGSTTGSYSKESIRKVFNQNSPERFHSRSLKDYFQVKFRYIR